jgi:hypothetical protein
VAVAGVAWPIGHEKSPANRALRSSCGVVCSRPRKLRSSPRDRFHLIEAIDDEMRALIVRNWPDLAAKLPPEQ